MMNKRGGKSRSFALFILHQVMGCLASDELGIDPQWEETEVDWGEVDVRGATCLRQVTFTIKGAGDRTDPRASISISMQGTPETDGGLPLANGGKWTYAEVDVTDWRGQTHKFRFNGGVISRSSGRFMEFARAYQPS